MQMQAPVIGLDADYFVHQYFDIPLIRKDGANGLRDIGRGKDGQSDLVEQRLESMVIAAVDEGYVDWHVGQRHSGAQAGETATDQDHTRPPG